MCHITFDKVILYSLDCLGSLLEPQKLSAVVRSMPQTNYPVLAAPPSPHIVPFTFALT